MFDRDGRMWFTVQFGNFVGRLEPKTGAFFARAPFPSGAGTVRNMVFDRGTRQIWFGTDHDTIGRAMVP